MPRGNSDIPSKSRNALSKAKRKGDAVEFSEETFAKWVTGAHKRRVERQKIGHKEAADKVKAEKAADRREQNEKVREIVKQHFGDVSVDRDGRLVISGVAHGSYGRDELDSDDEFEQQQRLEERKREKKLALLAKEASLKHLPKWAQNKRSKEIEMEKDDSIVKEQNESFLRAQFSFNKDDSLKKIAERAEKNKLVKNLQQMKQTAEKEERRQQLMPTVMNFQNDDSTVIVETSNLDQANLSSAIISRRAQKAMQQHQSAQIDTLKIGRRNQAHNSKQIHAQCSDSSDFDSDSDNNNGNNMVKKNSSTEKAAKAAKAAVIKKQEKLSNRQIQKIQKEKLAQEKGKMTQLQQLQAKFGNKSNKVKNKKQTKNKKLLAYVDGSEVEDEGAFDETTEEEVSESEDYDSEDDSEDDEDDEDNQDEEIDGEEQVVVEEVDDLYTGFNDNTPTTKPKRNLPQQTKSLTSAQKIIQDNQTIVQQLQKERNIQQNPKLVKQTQLTSPTPQTIVSKKPTKASQPEEPTPQHEIQYDEDGWAVVDEVVLSDNDEIDMDDEEYQAKQEKKLQKLREKEYREQSAQLRQEQRAEMNEKRQKREQKQQEGIDNPKKRQKVNQDYNAEFSRDSQLAANITHELLNNELSLDNAVAVPMATASAWFMLPKPEAWIEADERKRRLKAQLVRQDAIKEGLWDFEAEKNRKRKLTPLEAMEFDPTYGWEEGDGSNSKDLGDIFGIPAASMGGRYRKKPLSDKNKKRSSDARKAKKQEKQREKDQHVAMSFEAGFADSNTTGRTIKWDNSSDDDDGDGFKVYTGGAKFKDPKNRKERKKNELKQKQKETSAHKKGKMISGKYYFGEKDSAVNF
jgi:hypothetical protein